MTYYLHNLVAVGVLSAIVGFVLGAAHARALRRITRGQA